MNGFLTINGDVLNHSLKLALVGNQMDQTDKTKMSNRQITKRFFRRH